MSVKILLPFTSMAGALGPEPGFDRPGMMWPRSGALMANHRGHTCYEATRTFINVDGFVDEVILAMVG